MGRRPSHPNASPWNPLPLSLSPRAPRAPSCARPSFEYAASSAEVRFRPTAPTSIAAFLATPSPASAAHLVAVFRGIVAALKTPDYHLRLLPCAERGLRIVARLTALGQTGPVAAAVCMSCSLDASLAAGLHGDARGGGESLCSRDTVLYDDDVGAGLGGVRIWFDAKARTGMLIVTPLRHVESLGEMEDGEVAALWGAVGRVVGLEGYGADDVVSVVVNSGKCRNHAHLHVKLRLATGAFLRAKEGWDAAAKARWDRLEEFALGAGRPDFDQVLKQGGRRTTVMVGDLDVGRRGEVEGMLRKICGAFGEIRNCRVVYGKQQAFVQFARTEDAARCIFELYRTNPVPGSASPTFFTWGSR